jgi:hypothetical protein
MCGCGLTQVKVRQSCHVPWCPHGAEMDQAANEGLPAAALFDSLTVSSPVHTGAPVLAPPPAHQVRHDPRRCLGEALAVFVMAMQSVATQRGPSRPPAERSRHGQRVAERTSQHARRDRMPQTVWPLSITGLMVWLLLLGAGCASVRPARRQSCWHSARRMMPRWRRRRAPSWSGLWRA